MSGSGIGTLIPVCLAKLSFGNALSWTDAKSICTVLLRVGLVTHIYGRTCVGEAMCGQLRCRFG